jgi:carboxymethylenebutenolidase
MAERLTVDSFDGKSFDVFLDLPASLPAPGVVMIPEMYGITQPLREIAARYAERGFVVGLVDIFWRLRPSIELSYDKEGSRQASEYHRAFDYQLGSKDVQAAITRLRAQSECNGRVGVVGFCLGGTVAYLAVAYTDADAAVGYYGTRIHNFLHAAAEIHRPLMLHFGGQDHTTPPEIMDRIVPALAGNDQIIIHTHPEAGHAFTNHYRPDRYNAEATHRADEATFSFLRRTLNA